MCPIVAMKTVQVVTWRLVSEEICVIDRVSDYGVWWGVCCGGVGVSGAECVVT